MIDLEIKSLKDLNSFRSAPTLDPDQSHQLLKELSVYMDCADWFTIGIMAPSTKTAILILKEIENHYHWSAMQLVTKPEGEGPVFLKANQNTGDVHVRIEHGLGEGILLSCQNNEDQKDTHTFGPFPLDFFKVKN